MPSTKRALMTTAALGVLVAVAGIIQPVAASALPLGQIPNVPNALGTSPVSACPGDTILGDGDVTLNAAVSSSTGVALGVGFRVSQPDAGTVVVDSDPATLSATSGTTAVYRIPAATLEAAAGGKITEFNWKAQATAAAEKSGWSTVCHFSFDPTRPETPTVAQPGATTIGKPVTLAVTAPTSGSIPSGYQYQLNSGAPVSVTASTTGGASITLTPTSSVNTLTVTSLSPGGNVGGTASIQFVSARPPADLTDGDLTGDGVPDLVTVGAQNGLPSGLWLAAGAGNGHVATSPIDIGVNGNGFNSAGSPSDFDGATVITGRFTGGSNQDVLVYYPAGVHAGSGVVLHGNGNSSPLAAGGNNLSSGSLADSYGNNPTQLVDAGNTSGSGNGFPDLIGIAGDSTHGYALNLYPAFPIPGSFASTGSLNVNTPDGTADWNNWTIAATQLPASGGGTSTAMYLWKKSTGELDLWENLAVDPFSGNFTYNAFPVATGWNTGAAITLQAADINGDGVPDLWTVGAGETVTANLFSQLSASGPATLTTVTDTLN
ncbi:MULTISPECIES: hypothetical protein [unclassified Kitasatospora]|uniref:hypothetical protein n=1 Tax=unclassified Kitasatospora TaxID=2633591 RepID=UPI002474C5D8|nr:hypothetical protein [Kitasatospora sp. MAP12-44]